MKHDRGLCGCVPKSSSQKSMCRHLVFASWPCSALRLRAASRQHSVQNCFLAYQTLAHLQPAHLQPFRLKMPKRRRDPDTGVWAVADSVSEDETAMVVRAVPAPLAGAAPEQPRCPLTICQLCAWNVPPAQHEDHVFVYDMYKKKLKTLEDEPELTPAIKCQQSQLLNFQLMSLERQLFDNGHIKENDPLMPLIYLRSGAHAEGPWGMVSLPGLPLCPPAGSRAGGSGEASAAAAGTGDDGAADGAGEGAAGGAGGGKKKKKKKMTLASMEAWSRDQWVEWDNDNQRYEWSYDYELDVKVKTDEGTEMQSYPHAAKQMLLDAYFDGRHRVDFTMTITDGRHAGSVHNYVVYWINANEGLQFNPQSASAAVRKVVLTRTPWPIDDPPTRWWNPESREWEDRRGW